MSKEQIPFEFGEMNYVTYVVEFLHELEGTGFSFWDTWTRTSDLEYAYQILATYPDKKMRIMKDTIVRELVKET